VLQTSSGKPQPVGGRPGEARFLVRAPAARGPRPLRLEAALRGDPQTTVVADLPIAAGPPSRLRLRPDRARLPLGEGSSMRIYLVAEDAYGNPTDASAATVLVDGVPLATRPADDGGTMAVVPAPARYTGRDHLELEAALGGTYASHRIPLANLPAAPRLVRPPRLMVTPRLGMVWNLRRTPGAALLLEVLGRRQSWPSWLAVGLSLGLLSIDSTAADELGVSDISLMQLPLFAVARATRPLTGRLMVGIGVGVGAVWTDARVTSFGRDVPGQRLAPGGEVGGELALRLAVGQLVLGLHYLVVQVGELSSGDRLLGNTAGLVADLGYRLAW
jgi:hypothetical protein